MATLGRQEPLAPAAPAPRTAAEPAPRPRPESAPAHRPQRGGGLLLPVLGALLAGLLVGGLGASLLTRSDNGDAFGGALDTTRYQAVLLSNDKVYFGRLSSVSSEFYRLNDAFFLREARDSPDAEPLRALLPVNREIHAPENSMLIRKDEVVLVENLDEESPILLEIHRQKGDGE